ncbi:MAG: hypothetical protein HZB63_06100 [Deltaproteobacteria bacterium]|nr:hypothetical protein [Deltaproteobacteria bacterium]
MGSSVVRKRTFFFAGILFPAAILLFLIFGLPTAGHAADFTVAGGIVERVSGASVTLESGTYDIGRARIKTPSGEERPLSEVARGRRVDLFVSKGKVTAVIIYPASMLQ